jgi:receptor protein-tyrosine kinase
MNSTTPSEAFAVHPDRNERAARGRPDNSIGAILVRSGRLSVADADAVMRFSAERKLRFGDAAVELGVLSAADIALALSRQYDYPYLLPGESAIGAEVVAAYEPFTSRVEALRALRSQLMWRWFDTGKERRALAIASAGSGDGRSFLAANLAVVFSQQHQRTLLIDADLRAPRQHALFGLDNRAGLAAVLAGRSGQEAIQRVPALVDLSVLTAGALAPNPSELLGLPAFGRLLRELAADYDVILIDTAPGDAYADAQLVASRAGAALVVAHQHHSHVNKLHALVGLLSAARVHLVGTVLNEY